jgi:hypothetical protein
MDMKVAAPMWGNKRLSARDSLEHPPHHRTSDTLAAKLGFRADSSAIRSTTPRSSAISAFSRDPLERVTGRRYEIPQFVAHLKKFCGDEKGSVLQITGEGWRHRYRFANPLMRPYVVLRGIREGMIKEDAVGRVEHIGNSGLGRNREDQPPLL